MSASNTSRRRRPSDASKDMDSKKSKPSKPSPSSSALNFSFLDGLRFLTGVALLSIALSYFITGESLFWGWKPWFLSVPQVKSYVSGPLSLTDDELLLYNGEDKSKPIYLGFNGSIYDVSASPQTYGPGGSYHFFAGRDAVRAYITGCFAEDLSPDLRGVEEMYVPRDDPEEDAKLTKGELKIRRERDWRVARKKVNDGIEGWAKVFKGETGRPYFWVGTIKRDPNWLKKTPKPELCEQARDGRPTRSDAEKILKE